MVMLHGTVLCIYGLGVLITGKPGIGKSELALDLIDRGHQLVCDDATGLFKDNNQVLTQCPHLLQHLLHVRDIGVINIANHYGMDSIKDKQTLDFIIELTQSKNKYETVSLKKQYQYEIILGVKILKATLLARSQRNLPLLTETLVREFKLNQEGYDASNDFNKKHQLLIGQNQC